MAAGPPSTTKNWFQYPFANDYGGLEPYGPNPKADINVQVPQGVQISNITPGTVTNVDYDSAWGYAVTIKMDQPYNNLATHAAYLHLASVSVSKGQHVELYDNIGTAGPPTSGNFQPAPLGFAFYPGDWYGKGPEWNLYYANTSTPNLNPYTYLQNYANLTPAEINKGVQATISKESGSGIISLPCAPWDIGCIMDKIGKSGTLQRIGKGVLGGLLILIGVVMAVLSLMDKNPSDLAGVFKPPKPKIIPKVPVPA